jgi:disulfide bond formation protein DsbB
MTPLVSAATYLMGIGTLVLHLALVVFIVGTLASPTWREWLHERLGRHGTIVSFTIVAASLVGSIFYSEVAGFAACLLCWVVRALVYPQLIVLGAYLYKPRHWLLTVALVMSSLATLVSLYQMYLQFGGTSIVNCDVIPSLGSCSVEYFRIFGYITLATMSVTSTLALVVCQAVTLHRKHWLPARERRASGLER